MNEGKKYDDGKPMMELIPPHAELELAKVLTFGAIKYEPDRVKRLMLKAACITWRTQCVVWRSSLKIKLDGCCTL